ncbi:MAG: glycosyltransferase family 4 protein [Cyanobacteria bacterium CRU_2_1]|nr:glycosyltransferase family 4 protein [Hydrococcus sp. RU_2_2]NJR58145.1 glycosyltransferase family 4 protein [Cyanobacteria bacterium CRU_2_1]
MRYHIALSKSFDLAGIHQAAQQSKRPRHVLGDLSQQLGAMVHQPDHHPISRLDKVGARIVGQPEHWAMARAIVAQLEDDDLVFCAGEDSGFPLAILCRMMGKRAKLTVTVMAPDRLRVRGVLKLFGLANQIDLFLVNTQAKADTLRRFLDLPSDRVYQLPEQTDTSFFTPGAASPTKTRPIIASAGLEQRDYQTLAEATCELEVDVNICAVSPNASTSTRVAMPKVTPDNMTLKHYDWVDLLQLYRDADVVAISLLDNHYAAGLTTLMEAMACRRPIVMTRTPGLAEQLIDLGVVMGVAPGDVDELRQAIVTLLENRELAESLAQRAYALVTRTHSSEVYIECLVERLSTLTTLPTKAARARPTQVQPHQA